MAPRPASAWLLLPHRITSPCGCVTAMPVQGAPIGCPSNSAVTLVPPLDCSAKRWYPAVPAPAAVSTVAPARPCSVACSAPAEFKSSIK